MSELLEKIHKSELAMLCEAHRICEQLGLTYYLSCGTLLGCIRHKGFIPWDEDLDLMMPRKDYEEFISKAPEMLGKDFYLDDHSTNPLYFNPFAKLRLKNTAFEIKALKNYKGGQELWMDIFPMDDAPDVSSPELAASARTIGLCRAVICAKRGIFDFSVASRKQKLVMAVMRLLPEKTIWNKMLKAHTCHSGDNYVIFGTDYNYKKLVMPKEWFSPAAKGEFEGGKYLIPSDSDKVLTHIYGDYMKIPPKEKQVTFYPERILFADGQEVFIEE